MKRILSLLGIVLFLTISLVYVDTKIHADTVSCNSGSSIDQLQQCMDQLNQELTMSQNATHPLQSQLQSMQQQISAIKDRVAVISDELVVKQQNIDAGYKQIAQKEQILNATIRDYYIKNSYNSPLLVFLSGTSASQITQTLAYQKAAADQDKAIITNLAVSIVSLQQQKQELQTEETNLTALKTSLDTQSNKLNSIIQGALAYQQSLTSQIAQLSAQQQSLIAAKQASLNLPTTAYTTSSGCSSDINPYKDPGFGGTKFGFFTYGVPNRVGLNQYGAMGRAQAGQSYQQILQAYYNADLTTGYNQSITIHVAGTNDYGESIDENLSIEDYLKHIYEMPTSGNWTANNGAALEAQAIAARSYALAYTNNGATSICTDQHCQEFKQELNSQAWIDAVNATAGQVLTSGGQPIKAWFSSTHGGYVHASSDIGWSATSYTKTAQDASQNIGSWSDLNNYAYDKASPWFYCDWGGRSADNNTAWLQSSEVADIANVVKLAQVSNQDQNITQHLYQTDKPNPANSTTWSSDQVKQALQNQYGTTPMNSVSSVSMSADFGAGKTTTVTISGDAGTWSFPGDFFKAYFDLRAPANIQIVGPLYNIETR